MKRRDRTEHGEKDQGQADPAAPTGGMRTVNHFFFLFRGEEPKQLGYTNRNHYTFQVSLFCRKVKREIVTI
jgi:hypothetical protein